MSNQIPARRNGEVTVKFFAATHRWPRVYLAVAAITGSTALGGLFTEIWRTEPLAVATAAEPKGLPASAPSGLVQAQVSPQPSPPVPVVRPKVQSVADYVDLTGNAAAVNAVKLVARVEGYLDKIHYEDGQFVKKGDLLFTIQQDQYKDQLQQSQAQVLTAQAALIYAKTEVVRYTALVKKDAATQTEVDHWNSRRRAPTRHCCPLRRRSRGPS
jgi:multidrug efflux pump subunit AcrA (membrane-fusion protein)